MKKSGRNSKLCEQRSRTRRAAVQLAAKILREYGVEFECGDSLVVVPRFKLMFAFDSADLLKGIEAHAKVIGSDVVHISEEIFHKTKFFRGVILQELKDRKPVYAGSKNRTIAFWQ